MPTFSPLDPAAISCPQSPHVTLSFFLSLGVVPSPVIVCPYVYSDLFPGVLHVLHFMHTVFLWLVFNLTLSKIPTSTVKSHCNHRGSDDAIMPSSA